MKSETKATTGVKPGIYDYEDACFIFCQARSKHIEETFVFNGLRYGVWYKADKRLRRRIESCAGDITMSVLPEGVNPKDIPIED